MATIPEALAVAVQHHQAGRLHLAEQIYRQILEAEPNYADVIHLLGVVAHQAGKPGIAIEYIERAIRLKGDQAVFLNNLGLAYAALGRFPEAADCHRRALALMPECAETHFNLANALHGQGKLDEAVDCYRRALELMPDHAAAWSNLGNALKEQGKLDDAVAGYRRAVALKPDSVAAYSNLGTALQELGRLEEAAACHHRALELMPEFAEGHYNLGNALQDQGNLEEAAACYRRALELKPDHAHAYYNLGNVLRGQGKPREAVACYDQAIRLQPDYAEAHHNLGVVLKDQGNLDHAAACCDRALELRPDLAEAHYSRSLLRLLRGDFAQGWPEYEWRWRMKERRPRTWKQTPWDGRPLPGKTIILHAEQGLGDTIQFIRYAALARQRRARVIVECQRPLLPLLAGCPAIDLLIGQGEELPDCDVHVPLMSMPGICGTTLDNVPAEIPYISASPGLVAKWRDRLAALDGYKVGICWQGNPRHRDDRLRSLPLRSFAVLAQVPGVRLISLQKGAGSEQVAGVRSDLAVVDWTDKLDGEAGPFMDTAAIMKNLDLVVTSDTAIAHLAGAMGVPVWVALPFVPDWRWLLDRRDSPWYPTMRLFRQSSLGDWAGVFGEMQAQLCETRKHVSQDGARYEPQSPV
jgi:tetratricopeptide (TPR) repeat protein